MATRQQFIFNDKTVNITTILFKNLTPLLNVEKIVFFKETGLTGNWLKKEVRYSFDNISWSKWKTLNQGQLSNIDFNNHPNFYIEILYTRANYNTAGITDFYLFYDADGGTPPDPSTGTIDADTLQGQPGSFYLDPSNFVGAYPGIQMFNVEDSSSAGVYSHRIDTSVGSEFYFKRIEGGDNVEIIDSSLGIITINVDASGVGGASYENSAPVTTTVGGISSGETFFDGGKTFAETMAAIFYPTQYPSLSNPSLSFNDDIASLVKIGTNTIIHYTASFNPGSISPQYPPTASSNRSGDPNTYNYIFFGTSTPVIESSYANAQNIPHLVTQGVQTSTCNVSYDAGVQPYDSNGDPYNSPLSAGNTSTISRSFEGVYPLYGTTVTISNPNTEQTLVSMISANNIELYLVAQPFASPNKQSFDIPDVWLASRPLTGVETYNTLTSSWEYEGGSAAASLFFWSTTPASHVIGGAVVYTRYSYAGDDRGSTRIRLKF